MLFILLFPIMIANIDTLSGKPMLDNATMSSENRTTEATITSHMPKDLENRTDTLSEKPIFDTAIMTSEKQTTEITITAHMPEDLENGTNITNNTSITNSTFNGAFNVTVPTVNITIGHLFNLNFYFSLFSAMPRSSKSKTLPTDKGEEGYDLKKKFEQYKAECKAELTAKDDDLSFFNNREQLPANEAQSCLVKCVDAKVGLVKDGKLNHEIFMNAAKHIHSNNPEKLVEVEKIFKKCESEVAKASPEKCAVGNVVKPCMLEVLKLR